MVFRRSSLLIRKSVLANALSNCDLYSSLFQLPLARILYNTSLLCFSIDWKAPVFAVISCLSFCKEIIKESLHCSFENV